MSVMEPEVASPVISTQDGDHEKFAHIVVPKEAVTEAYMNGTPVTALCGKTWVPSRDPLRYPLCPECDRIRNEAVAMRQRGGA